MSPRAPTFHGWLNIDKPLGLTSAHVVAKVRRLARMKRVGHAGTLDPLASGVLPIALGEATKTAAYVTDAGKSYTFTVRWGQATATDDAEGEVTATSDARPAGDAIRALLPEFTGLVRQTPPRYSAIKVDGERAYALARAGEAVELAAREVRIDRLALSAYDGESATFAVDCGKGTYVRAIARDLGERLGCFGHVTALRRTRVGKFDENRAISLETLEELVHTGRIDAALVPIPLALDGIPALEVAPDQASALRHGQPIAPRHSARPGDVLLITSAGEPVALAQAAGVLVKPVRCFVWD